MKVIIRGDVGQTPISLAVFLQETAERVAPGRVEINAAPAFQSRIPISVIGADLKQFTQELSDLRSGQSYSAKLVGTGGSWGMLLKPAMPPLGVFQLNAEFAVQAYADKNPKTISYTRCVVSIDNMLIRFEELHAFGEALGGYLGRGEVCTTLLTYTGEDGPAESDREAGNLPEPPAAPPTP